MGNYIVKGGPRNQTTRNPFHVGFLNVTTERPLFGVLCNNHLSNTQHILCWWFPGQRKGLCERLARKDFVAGSPDGLSSHTVTAQVDMTKVNKVKDAVEEEVV